ncbi:hypothetical protein M8J77_014117 [Diaphorina citri]|nr:hypothetical protein M8J77_014117 [Diaphorina citri]
MSRYKYLILGEGEEEEKERKEKKRKEKEKKKKKRLLDSLEWKMKLLTASSYTDFVFVERRDSGYDGQMSPLLNEEFSSLRSKEYSIVREVSSSNKSIVIPNE